MGEKSYILDNLQLTEILPEGGGAGLSASLLPENNAQISPDPFKYFFEVPKTATTLQIPKSNTSSPQFPIYIPVCSLNFLEMFFGH